MVNQWQHCTLDDDSLQQLDAYKQDLADAEQEILALETEMKAQIADLNRTTKVAASLITKSDNLLETHRIKLTATTPGTDIHKYRIVLANPGANLQFTQRSFMFAPNLYLKMYPPQYGVEPTDEPSKMFYDANVIYVEVETDSEAQVWTTPETLAQAFTDAGYDALFTSETPDTFTISINFVTFTVSMPVVADGTQYQFEGGKDTPFQDLTTGFNDLYAGTGKDLETALEQLEIPVAKTSQSPREILSQISDLLPLSTGKLVKCSGNNLSSLRALWTLLGADEEAATTVCGLLPGLSGYPLVVWTKQVTEEVEVEACDGGGVQSLTTTEVLGSVNERLSLTTGATPYVFWLEEIAPSVETLALLSRVGLSSTQIETALDDTEDTVYVIPEPDLLTSFDLSCSEFLELLQLADCEGVTSVTVQAALSELGDFPAGESTGFVSASFNFPGGASGGGVGIRSALSPETSMAESISALSTTKCIDPLAIGSITSFIASASSMIDVALAAVERTRSTIAGPLNTISKLVANTQGVLNSVEKLGCLLPIDALASVKGPSLDFLLPQIELAFPQIGSLLEIVQAVLEKVNAISCQMIASINSLLGPVFGTAECLVPGITNEIANAFGAALPNPLDAIPCIEDPFDLVGMFQELLGKIVALADMVTAMTNDILELASQLQLSVNIEDKTDVQEATSDCSSGPLGAIATSIKSKLSV